MAKSKVSNESNISDNLKPNGSLSNSTADHQSHINNNNENNDTHNHNDIDEMKQKDREKEKEIEKEKETQTEIEKDKHKQIEIEIQKDKDTEIEKDIQKETEKDKDNDNDNDNDDDNDNDNDSDNDKDIEKETETEDNDNSKANSNEDEIKNEDDINHIMKIFKKFKCSRIILSYLRISHIVSLSFLSKSLNKTVNKYYGDCAALDLSEYYGVIGSPEFDHQSFMNVFLPRFKSIQSLSLRYCSHLKVVHLDNMIKALTVNSSIKETENDDNLKNEKIKSLNLYFCSRLNSRALWKISSRLINLEYLNLARCYAITADGNINGLKLLGSLPLKELAISLDPSIQKAEAIDVYSLLIDEDSFRYLKILDLSHGCEVLHEIEDLSDLTQIRKIQIIKPIKHNK